MQVPSAPGAVLQVIERNGKVIAVVGDQEVEIPNQTGQPTVSLGDNGELRLTSATTTKIDVTDMANAQARLLADKELAEQSRIHEAEMKKEKSSRNKERLVWIVGTAGGAHLLTK
ncbi:hypothetical protein SPFL3102_02659 [Sporomusaceae bacterium FL31]|nr:hypothetical protein SPFL3101_02634 [Sporomusaceae bacterium FL31]GCE34832.1 hypothetical protein SPFL3102_02659 [Sporomusaceae bacterium]